MKTIFCKPESICVFRSVLLRTRLRKQLGFLLLFFITSFQAFSQTSLSFTQIPTSDPEIIGPGRGAEDWNGMHLVSIPSAGSPNNSVDYYFRFFWTDIQDYSTGAFTWNYFDSKVQIAIDRGSRFNFGVMAFYPGQGPNVGGSTLNYPLVVHNAMQAEPTYKDNRDTRSDYPGYNSWVPNWNAPSFRTYYNAMMDAVIAHLKSTTYKGIKLYDAVGYVDIRTYGNTGEWTGYNKSTNPSYMPANSVATAATQIQFIDDMVARFPDKQLVICTAAVTGMAEADGQPNEVAYHVFTTSNKVGRIGLRRDCVGETDPWVNVWFENNPIVYNGMSLKDQIMNIYKVAPWIGEPCSCCTTTGGSGPYWDFARQVAFYHMAGFGNGNLENATNATVQNNIRAASKAAGYRLVLNGGSMTTNLAANAAFNISLNWRNIGVAPVYENWNVTFELRNGSSVVWTGTSQLQLRLFLPAGTDNVVSDNFTLPSIASGTYSLYLVVRDPTGYRKPLPLAITGQNTDGSYLLRSNITVGAGNGNKAPTANAGANQTLTLPTATASLSGTGTDADGTIASYAWAKVSGPSGGVITSPAAANTTITGLTQGVYVYSLTVTDNQGSTGTSNVQITVNSGAGNQSPVAKAGSDITLTLPANSTNLNGSASSDPDGSIASYEWSLISGPTQFSMANKTSASTALTNLAAGTYSFQLKVTDNNGATALDTVKITVNAAVVQNKPPVANAGTDITITLPTNVTNLTGNASSDPDGSIASYAWTRISGPSQYNLASAGSANSRLSNLVAGVYTFQLKVTDNNGATDLDTVTVTVNAAIPQNQPPIANAGAGRTITLPTNSVTLNGGASLDQDGTITSYAWSQDSGPAAASIASPASASTSVSGLQQGVYIFTLKVTDNSGATGSDTVTITVNSAANRPPVARAGNSRTISLPTNSVSLDGSGSSDPDGTISSYQWTQITGPSTSTITSGSSPVATASDLVAGQYTFQITVTDDDGAIARAQVKITVVPSGNQPPVANAGANQTITLPRDSVTIDGGGSASSTGSIVSYAWEESSGPTTVPLTNTVSNVLDNLQAGKYVFYLTVTDNDGKTASDSVIITVNPAANRRPIANAGSNISMTLPNNTATLDGSNSYDPDGSISTYSWTRLSGPNTPAATGASTAILNLSGLAAGQYTYQLTVTDNSGASSSAQVKIYVALPPNIPPYANAGPNQTITAPAGTINLDGSDSYDLDGTITTYSWVKVSGPGSITISNSNTATPSVIGLLTGAYVFELTVTDNRGATAKDQVTITVNPQPVKPNQLPIANAGSNITITYPQNSISLNGNSSFDPDGTLSAFAWVQVSGPSTATMSAGNTATPTVSNLSIGQYIFELTVRDNNGATDKDQVTVNVNPAVPKANQAPIADAGPDTTISLPITAYVLDATGSSDPDGTITAYQWVEISGPNPVTSSSMDNAKVSIGDLQPGDYIFQVTVTDNQGVSSAANVKVSVEEGAGPGDQLTVYPNPAHDVLNGKISSSVTGTTKMNIYDLNGRLVQSGEIEKPGDVVIKTMSIDRLASGMYTLQINIANKKTMVAKFIKN